MLYGSYDPSIMKNFLWGQGPNSDTQFRYMIIHDALTAYAQAGVKVRWGLSGVWWRVRGSR